MKIIVGLGNPGAQYINTRHNVGFRVVQKFAKVIAGTGFRWQEKFQAKIFIHHFQSEEIILVKPQTYMNLSGKAVKDIIDYYNINYQQLLVIYDDLYLPLGKIRIRKRGSSGGHRGLDSIINSLKSDDFPRLRIGIRNDKLLDYLDYTNFVLTNFLPEEKEVVEKVINQAVQAIEDILVKGYEFVMREYN